MIERIFIWCLVIGVFCLGLWPTAVAEEKISYTITITIPKIIEHSQLQHQAEKENADKKTEKENKNTNPYLFYEPLVVVKTIIQEP